MKPEDERILDILVPDSQLKEAAVVKEGLEGSTGEPSYFTGDPERDTYAWFEKNTAFWRKCGSWDTIPRVDRLYIPDGVRAFIDSMPVLNITSLWPNGKPEFPLEDFDDPVMFQWFLMQDGGTTYLVDTEGYQYPRYCCELAGNWM
jgi:hypothetical protein